MNPNDDNQRRKVRGPYKRYLDPESNVPVPKSTLRDRAKRARDQDSAGGAGLNQLDNDMDMGDEVNPRTEHEDAGDALNPGANEGNTLTTGLGDEEQVLDEHPNAERGPKPVDYVKKYNLNTKLHQLTGITRLDVLLMILHLAVRHCHTQSFIEHQIAFVNTLFGEGSLDISYHIFKNLFPPASSINRHYFCPQCELYIGSSKELENLKEKACTKCGKMINVKSVDSGNYFISLSVKEQIEKLLNTPGIKLVYNRSDNVDLCDIFDGDLFKSCELKGLSLKDCLTVTFNTDGVSIHESTQNTLWPIFVQVNEIVPEQRFQVDNLILAGLWFGRSAPNMALYLKPFLSELIDLSQNGVRVTNADGIVKVYPVFAVECSVDSVAKPKLVCQKQFNAYCGCLYCEHPNNAMVSVLSKQRFYDTSKSYPSRTEEQVVENMFEADKQDREGTLKDGSVNGFVGISILLLLSKLSQYFSCNPLNIVWSVVIDYMHSALEGVGANLIDSYLRILSSDQLKIGERGVPWHLFL